MLHGGAGNWRVADINERVVGLNLLRKPQGLVIYHLRSYPTSTSGVHNVEVSHRLRARHTDSTHILMNVITEC